MQPADAVNVVNKATSVSWEAGLLALVCLILIGLVSFHYRAMWSHIRQTALDSQDVIDDNTLAWLQVARVFALRPCLHDSDAEELLRKNGVKPETFGHSEEHVKRVVERRVRRQTMKDKPT